jgi:hypothetical protein
VLFATAELPMISTFSRAREDRYPIRSVETGTVMGDLRMSILYNQVAIRPNGYHGINAVGEPIQISLTQLLAGEEGVRLLYYLSARGQLDGTPDLFARIGLADGSNLPRLLAMCRLESQSSMLCNAS